MTVLYPISGIAQRIGTSARTLKKYFNTNYGVEGDMLDIEPAILSQIQNGEIVVEFLSRAKNFKIRFISITTNTILLEKDRIKKSF